MSLTDFVLRFAAPLPIIEEAQRFLFLGPHPDDIEIGAGATAAKLSAAGKDICFLICTDGRFGLPNAPKGTTPEELVSIRREEALRSAEMLGVHDVRFLDFSDGGLYEQTELIRAVALQVGKFKPEVIFAPDPDVSSECHIDHKNVGNAAKSLACFAPYEALMAAYGAASAPVKAVALYMTAKPNQYINTRAFLEPQLDALFTCHHSQFPQGSGDERAIRIYLKLRSADLGLRCLSTAAEGFRVLGQTQMHCLPEAGK